MKKEITFATEIVDYNRGQVPERVAEAMDMAGFSRGDVQEYIWNNGLKEGESYTVSPLTGDFSLPGGWMYGLRFTRTKPYWKA